MSLSLLLTVFISNRKLDSTSSTSSEILKIQDHQPKDAIELLKQVPSKVIEVTSSGEVKPTPVGTSSSETLSNDQESSKPSFVVESSSPLIESLFDKVLKRMDRFEVMIGGVER